MYLNYVLVKYVLKFSAHNGLSVMQVQRYAKV